MWAEREREARACPVRPGPAHRRVGLWSAGPLDEIGAHGSCGRTRALRHVHAHAHGRALGTATLWGYRRLCEEVGQGQACPRDVCCTA